MPLIAVQSSNLAAYAYDEVLQELYLEFQARRHGGRTVWAYEAVPLNLWTMLQQAESKGSFVARYVVSKFRARRLTDAEIAKLERPA